MAAKRRRLAQRRRALGFTQEALAERLAVDPTTVRRWESGGTEGGPRPWLRPKLAQVLRVSADQLEALLTEAGAETAAPASKGTLPHTQSGTPRNVLLSIDVDGRPVIVPVDSQTVAASGLGLPPYSLVAASLPKLGLDELQHVAAALSEARRYFDGSVVDYFRRQLAICKTDDGRLGPKQTLPMVLGILGAIEEHVREVKPDLRRELLAVGADGAEFAGWLYRDTRDPRSARQWHDQATEWAQEAGDLPMQGYVLLKKSQMAYDERDALRVLTLAQAAQNGPWRLPSPVRAEVAQQEARGLAMTGEPLDLVERKLDEAAQHLVAQDEPHAHLSNYYNESTLSLRTASVYVEAGKPAHAAEIFHSVISEGSLSRRDEGYFRARRAGALALSGEPDHASEEGLRAAETATETCSQRTARELARVVRALDPWKGRPGPRALREALQA